MTHPTPSILDVSNRPVRRPGDLGKTGTNWQPGMAAQNPATGGVSYPGTGGGIQIVVSGPVFDGRARGLVAAMLEEMKYAVASQVLADWQFNMDRTFVHPTPYYETQVMVQRVNEDWTVHDRGIVYGGWLEGFSTRNQATSFKGYGNLRRAVDEVRQHRAQPICEKIAADYAPRFNG